jgi:tetratricopeptide (TPR) repeat protein
LIRVSGEFHGGRACFGATELPAWRGIYRLPWADKRVQLRDISMNTPWNATTAGLVWLAAGLTLTPALQAATPASPSKLAAPTADATGGGTAKAAADLKKLVERQRAALAEAATKESLGELEDVRPKLQRVVEGYEALVKANPDFAAAWAAYGLFLCEPVIENRKPALALLLTANRLDGDLPVVKNQIGVLLAEEGRVIEALNYFLAASDLAPEVALYHFQIGLLLDEARDVFLRTKAWTPATIDRTVLEAFRHAVELAPERTDYAYRAAEVYNTLAEPRWEEAYATWSKLETRLKGNTERQTVRLQMARTQWKIGHAAAARELAASVDEGVLQGQKAKLLAEFDAEDATEASAKKVVK